MKFWLITASAVISSVSMATPYLGNDATSSAMGSTGVASAAPDSSIMFNPALLADYSDDSNFSITIFPSSRFYAEDPFKLGENTEEFANETFADFENVDIDAYNTALNGDGGSEPSLADVFANLSAASAAIAATAAALETDLSDGALDDATLITQLDQDNQDLANSADDLDAKVLSIETQNASVTTLTANASSGLESLNDKPAQLGIGLDFLNVALPSRTFGMGLGISSTTTLGLNAQVSQLDLQEIDNIVDDLNELTAEVSDITLELQDVTSANDELVRILDEDEPDVADYGNNPSDPGYIAAVQAWGQAIDDQGTLIQAESDEVDTEVNEVQTITTTNGTITNGELDENLVDDLDLTSELEIVGATIVDVALSFARQIEFQGNVFAAGITPKMQIINLFERTVIIDEAGAEADTIGEDPVGYISDNNTTLYRANVDIGAAKTWDYNGQLRAGIALKDIIPWTLETDQGTELKIRPKLRVGASHETRFTTVSADLDITNNQPLKYGPETRYLGLGGEVRAWQHAAFRLGYRTNLSLENSHVFSSGIGLTPWGVGVDLAAWAQPGGATDLIRDAGFSMQFSASF